MKKGSWSKIAVFFLLGVIGLTCVGVPRRKVYEASDFVGTWRAIYQDVESMSGSVSGVETIALKADGTYQQTFEGERGYVYTSPWNKWWLESGRILHLEGGRFYPLGIKDAEDLASGRLGASLINPIGERVELDGTEIVLYASGYSDAPGGVVLEHLAVGDPDSPNIVRFYRVTTLVPVATPTP